MALRAGQGAGLEGASWALVFWGLDVADCAKACEEGVGHGRFRVRVCGCGNGQ